MNVRSAPDIPKARATVGDYAVRQNESDRSNSSLNEVMDSDFKPRHQRWLTCWTAQKDAEIAQAAAIRQRKAADKKLDQLIQRILKAIRYARGDGAPELKEYVPGGNMEQSETPLATQVSVLEPYAVRIASAPDDLIPGSLRQEFDVAFREAKQALGEAEAATRAAREALEAREAIEPEWDQAYGNYHRAVEYQMENDVTRIERWIYRFPRKK